jgi:hypothetical protein
MAALIEFVCIATHERRSDPSITLEQKSWAYCSWGALADHQWTRIDPTSIEALRSSAGIGRTRLVRGEDAETTATRRTT